MNFVKSILWDLAVKEAIRRLLAAWPLLAWGPIAPVVTWILTKIADKVFAELEKFAVTEGIRLRNNAHNLDFDRAALALQIVADSFGPDSEEFKRERENAKLRLSRLVRMA